MALIDCKECGQQISTKAESCPNCGAKVKKNISLGAFLVVIILSFFVFKSCSNNSVTDSIDIEQECYRLNGKKWRKNDSNFVKILNNHFQFYIADCRCDIIPILDIDIR